MSKVKVTLVKGINGRKPNHVATVKSLGLRKISQSAVHNKTADIEGKIKIKLKNPLTVLAVKGYSEEAKIDSCDITVYLFSDLEDDELIEFCKKSLNSCFIYNTLKDLMDINIKFIPIL